MSNRPRSHPLDSPHSLLVLLRVEGRRLRRVTQASIGAWAEGVAFLDDSRTLLAESIVDRAIYRLRIQGDALVPAGPPLRFGNGEPVASAWPGIEMESLERAEDAGHAIPAGRERGGRLPALE